MTPAEWQRIQEIVDAALDLPTSERAAYLNISCSGDVDLRCRAEALIVAHDRAGSFLDDAIGDIARSVLTPDAQVAAGSACPGQTISGYRIVSKIGQGGMGVVFKAEDTLLNRPVALKFLFQERIDGRPVTRLIREAKAASALNHPNIITIYGVIQSESTLAIAMEFVEGAPLRDRCGVPLLIANVIRTGRQIALALAAAHESGITHRDIKPENLIVRPDGCVKVVDFGLARDSTANNQSTQTGLVAGTLQYMSPEQIRSGKITSATDIFSLGVVLYEMATGRHPFAAASGVDTMYAIAHREPSPPRSLRPDIPAALNRLILRMLAKDPASRPSAGQVEAALLEAERPPAPILRRSVSLGLAAAVLSIIMAAAYRSLRAPPQVQFLEAVPFTTDPGVQMEPSLSPDGQSVAYIWTGPKDDNEDIYIRPLKGGPVRRFTSDPAPDLCPAWSRDGESLAFVRRLSSELGQIRIQPVQSGPSRLLAELRMPSLNSWQDRRSLNWSLDDQWLAISTNEQESDSYAVYLISVATGALRRLTNPPLSGRPFGDKGAVFSPDGKNLAFIRSVAEGGSELWVLALTRDHLAAGEPRQIPTGKPRNISPVWTPDGREIVLASGVVGRMNLSRISPWKGKPAQLVAGAGEGGLHPALPSQAGLSGSVALLYTKSIASLNLRSLEIRRDDHALPIAIRRVLQFAPDSSVNEHPNFSPDGKKVTFVSNRSGYREVWVADVDGTNQQQWTAMRCSDIAVPRWSYDSRRITFSAQCGEPTDVYVVDAPLARTRRLTDSPAPDENSTWSADGKWIYFTSYRTGGGRIWRIPASGGTAVQITHQPSSNAWISRDGQTLYFSSPHDGADSVWTMNAEGGAPKLLMSGTSFFAVGKHGLYFSRIGKGPNTSKPVALAYFDFAARRVIPVQFPGGVLGSYVFAVSADESSIMDSMGELHSCNLMKVEKFR